MLKWCVHYAPIWSTSVWGDSCFRQGLLLPSFGRLGDESILHNIHISYPDPHHRLYDNQQKDCYQLWMREVWSWEWYIRGWGSIVASLVGNLDCSLFTFVVFSSDALPCMRVLVTSVAATSRWLPAGGAAAAVSEPLRLFWGLPSPPSCYSWEAEEAAGTGSKGHFCQMLADGVLILKGDTDDIVWDKYK